MSIHVYKAMDFMFGDLYVQSNLYVNTCL
jgi:hypothetical protein